MTRACHLQRRRRLRLSASAGSQPDPALPVEFGRWILLAIGLGSKVESPFLHMTRDMAAAVKFFNLGRQDRGDNNNYLIRMPRVAIAEDQLVDMSTKARQDPQQQQQRWQWQRDRLSACQ